MPRPKKNVNPQTADGAPTAPAPKREAFAETELSSLATLGPAFAAGVDKLRAQVAAVATAKESAKSATKTARGTLKKLRAAAENVLAAGE